MGSADLMLRGGRNSVLTALVGSDPAAGAEAFNQTVPEGEAWELLGVRFLLVTDATVQTRNPLLTIDDGVNIVARIPCVNGQAASQTREYQFLVDAGYQSVFSGGGSAIIGIPKLTIPGGWRIRTVTESLQAGDNYGVPVLMYNRMR